MVQSVRSDQPAQAAIPVHAAIPGRAAVPTRSVPPRRPPWPVHGTVVRPWRARCRVPKADRMLTEVVAAVPPVIADADWTPPDHATRRLLDDAADRLADLDTGYGSRLGALDRVLVRTEAVSSSHIEHVHASVDDYARATVGSRANDAATAMVRATDALRLMVDDAGSGTITAPSVLAAHRLLMADDPDDGPAAGSYRTVQNWIGGGPSPRLAAHVPPPPEAVPALMDDLFAFLARDDLHPIAQAAIAHAQFESIHPFTDGNGRIGRALIGAVHRRRGLSTAVTVPVASALRADRARYFGLLARYRDGAVDDLVRLLGSATGVAAAESEYTGLVLDELPGGFRAALRQRGPLDPALDRLLGHLVDEPVLSASRIDDLTGVGPDAARVLGARCVAAGVLRPITDRRRDPVWCVGAVLDELDLLDARIAAGMTDHPVTDVAA